MHIDHGGRPGAVSGYRGWGGSSSRPGAGVLAAALTPGSIVVVTATVRNVG